MGAAVPLHRRPLPPPLCMPMVYCDAALSTTGYVVAAFKRGDFATACTAPTWIRSQQGAELYSIFHSLRQAAIRRLSHVCVVTDNEAAFNTVNGGRVSARHWDRVRLLRRINRICLQENLQLQLALTPSECNPADPFSRHRTKAPQRIPQLSHAINQTLRFCRYTSALPRI